MEAAPASAPAPAARSMGSVLHLVLPGCPMERPALSLRPGRWSQGSRRIVTGADAAVWACTACVAAAPDVHHRVIVFGGNAAGERAAAMGLAADGRIAPPFSRPELAASAVAAVIASGPTPDVIQCWGGDFALLRDRLAPRTPRSTWMIADMHAGVLEVRDNATPHDPLTQALTPWLEPGAKPLIDRASVRTRLGVAEEELLVTLVGDPPAAIDALPALYALGILHVAGVRATLVLPRGCGQFDRALRYVHQGGYLHGLRVTDEPLSLIAVGCDLGICAPLSWSENEPLCEPSFSTKLAVARAAALGLPVMMPTSPWAERLLPIGAHACLTPPGDHAALAKQIFGLLEEGRRPLRACRAELLTRSVSGPERGMTEEVVGAWRRMLAKVGRGGS